MYSILNPSNWPSNAYYYGMDEIGDILELYGEESTSSDEIIVEWRQLLTTIMSGEDWCKYKTADTIYFWQHYLKTGMVPPLLKSIVRKVLAIPIGSADAERSFSALFHIRTKRRSKLLPKNLEHFLRIRLNGPKDISKFPAQKFAKLWVEKNNYLTDDPRNRKTIAEQPKDDEDPADSEEQKKYLDESNLF